MKMLRRFQIPLASLLIGLILFDVLPALAASVTFRAASVQGQAGGTVDVPIEAVAAPSLGAVHIELIYDPKVVTPDTVSRGALAGTNALLDFNSGNPGRLLIGLVTLDAIKGDGAVATVRFKVIGDAGTSSDLTLQNSKAWESSSHAEVLVKTEAGKVTVVGGLPGWLLPALAALLLVVLLLILFFVLARRRRPVPQPAHIQPGYYAPSPVTPPRASPAMAPRPATLPGQQPPPPSLGMPEGKSPAPVTSSAETYKRAEDEYFRLKGRLSAGRLTEEQFQAAVKELMVQDAQGRYWMLGVDTGKWYFHNGQTWVEGQPY
jgi:uncharacterized membrane protein